MGELGRECRLSDLGAHAQYWCSPLLSLCSRTWKLQQLSSCAGTTELMCGSY